MLRSEHIPYNIFTPMEEDLSAAALLFNEIVGGGISKINCIRIEFAGIADKTEYLNDGTSFDISYESLFELMGKFFISENNQDWLKYLQRRYII